MNKLEVGDKVKIKPDMVKGIASVNNLLDKIGTVYKVNGTVIDVNFNDGDITRWFYSCELEKTNKFKVGDRVMVEGTISAVVKAVVDDKVWIRNDDYNIDTIRHIENLTKIEPKKPKFKVGDLVTMFTNDYPNKIVLILKDKDDNFAYIAEHIYDYGDYEMTIQYKILEKDLELTDKPNVTKISNEFKAYEG